MEEDQSRLIQLLSPTHINSWAVFLCLVVIIPALCFTKFRPLHMLEPTIDEYLLAGLAVFNFALLLFRVIRLAGIWAQLRRLLITLDSCPLRRGFNRLGDLAWSPLWRRGAGTLSDFRRLISRQSEALRCFFTSMSPETEDLQRAFAEQAEKTRAAFDTAADHYFQKWDWQLIRKGHQSQNLSPVPTSGTDPWVPIKEIIKVWVIPEQGKLELLLLAELEKLQEQFSIAGLFCLAFAVSEWDNTVTLAVAANECNPTNGSRADPASRSEARKMPTEEKCGSVEQFLVLLYTSLLWLP